MAIVMEYLQGKTVRGILLKKGSLSAQEAFEIGIKICGALASAHAKNIIHRDIKPENIFLCTDGTLKLMDFGMAKLYADDSVGMSETPGGFEENHAASLMTTRSLWGTPYYMSPEQIDQKQLDGRSDLFSLGIVLYELLAGIAPFQGQDSLEVMHAILQENPQPPHEVKKLNPDHSAVVLKALAKAPNERYASAMEIQAELNRVASPVASRREKKRRLALVALMLVLSLFVIDYSPEAPAVIETEVESAKLLAPSLIMSADFSSSGDQLIYGVHERLYATPISAMASTIETEPRTILDVPRGGQFSCSPKEESIAFAGVYLDPSGHWRRGGIHTADLNTGITKKLVNFGVNPRWSPSGEKIAFDNNFVGNVDSIAIYVYDLGQKSLEKISPENGLNYADPSWSPDEEWIVCIGGYDSDWELWLIHVASKTARQISHFKRSIRGPHWSPAGSSVYFSLDMEDRSTIWRMMIGPKGEMLSGKPMAVWTDASNSNINILSIAASGDRMLISKSSQQSEISITALPTAETASGWTVLSEPEISDLEYSPDGTKMVFAANPRGRPILKLFGPPGVKISVLYEEQPAFNPSWSADGSWIAFNSGGNNGDIWRVPAEGGRAERIFESPWADRMPTHSPDGKSICVLSNRSGQFDLWIINLKTRETLQLTDTKDVESRGFWSNDGKMIAFLQRSTAGDSVGIWVYDTRTTTARRIHQEATHHYFYFRYDRRLDWNPDDLSIYFLYDGKVSKISVQTGEIYYRYPLTVEGGIDRMDVNEDWALAYILDRYEKKISILEGKF
jgi:Tol biopolymer transport system component